MNDSTTDPAQIEADIRRTQDEMSRTVDQIGDQLSPRSIINALLDKAENNQIDGGMLIDGARRNPIALAMIAGGAIWLISDRDANFPRKRETGHGGDTRTPPPVAHNGHDTHSNGMAGNGIQRHLPGDYVSHMDKVEWRDGEDAASYQRRRDIARSNYFMIERGHEEDEGGFRQRLDAAAEALRGARDAVTSTASKMGSGLRDRGSDLADQARTMTGAVKDRSGDVAMQARDLYAENPIIGGLIAATIGAAIGASLEMTRMEEEQLSGIGQSARGMIDKQKDKIIGVARDQKDTLVNKAEQTISNEPLPQH